MKEYFANLDNYSHLIPEQLNTPEKIDAYINMPIYDVEPNELRNFPAVLIVNGNGDMVTAGLGDMALEVYDENGEIIAYKYGGMYEFNLTIEVGSRETFEREFLSDLITRILRVDLRRKMEAEGVLVKNIRYGGESVINYGTSHIYVSSINLSTWSEWYEDYDLLPMDDISLNNLNINKKE